MDDAFLFETEHHSKLNHLIPYNVTMQDQEYFSQNQEYLL